METKHVLEQAKKTIEDLSTIVWEHAGLSTSDQTEATLSAINEKLNPTTGRGHQVKGDLKQANSIKNSLESLRLELGNNPKFAGLASSLDAAISEAVDLTYSIDEALTLKV